MRIRPYRSQDAGKLCKLFFESVNGIGQRYYTPEQVRAWAQCKPDPAEFHARASDGRLILVAVDEMDDPVAYVDLEPDGHIDHLYCRPDMVEKGIGSALCDRIEEVARERGIQQLYVEASEPARPLFSSKGFVELQQRDFTVADVSIHNHLMKKVLRELP